MTMHFQLDGLSGAVGKKFYSLEKAEEWLRNPDSRRKKGKKNSMFFPAQSDVATYMSTESRR